jgi:cytochrome c oxidase subunit II
MNNPDHLRVWVRDPNVMKPGALMPAMNLDDKDLDDLVSYLATLR